VVGGTHRRYATVEPCWVWGGRSFGCLCVVLFLLCVCACGAVLFLLCVCVCVTCSQAISPPRRGWWVVRTVVPPPLSLVECGVGVRVVVCVWSCSCCVFVRVVLFCSWCVFVCVTCFSSYNPRV